MLAWLRPCLVRSLQVFLLFPFHFIHHGLHFVLVWIIRIIIVEFKIRVALIQLFRFDKGPISVNDIDEYPFIKDELEILTERLEADMPTLGICLGAQLIAKALGAKVYPGQHKEIGWAPIQLDDAGSRSALRHLAGEGVCVLHWHGETFDIPEYAEHLASSELYPNQAFSYGNTLALQFHPEVTARALEQWYVGHTCEIHQIDGISVNKLRDDSRQFADTLQARAYTFFSEWLEQVSVTEPE